ncbi:MAG: hypothetical protein KatS3mg055_1672 [Chloroflexus sp.]|nr:MAG: hypothetical protein KatS3mg055_1672 [Chloroflexus sp.]
MRCLALVGGSRLVWGPPWTGGLSGPGRDGRGALPAVTARDWPLSGSPALAWSAWPGVRRAKSAGLARWLSGREASDLVSKFSSSLGRAGWWAVQPCPQCPCLAWRGKVGKSRGFERGEVLLQPAHCGITSCSCRHLDTAFGDTAELFRCAATNRRTFGMSAG